MATTAERRQRALMYLRTLDLMVNDLPEVAEEWDRLSDGERESWSLDWGNEMAGLKSLAHFAAEGALTPSEYSQYQEVLRRLLAALPIVDRLNLRRPSMPLNV